MGIQKVEVANGIHWIEVPEVGLRVLCGCPADAVKHLVKRGLIQKREVKGVACETGPNAILLSDHAIQSGEFANLAEFPVLQMLYKQGLLIPGHPNNTGHKPMLIGSADQVDAQMRYIYRGNYGLVSREELMEAGAGAAQAAELMRLKLAFAFGRIRPTHDFLDRRVLGSTPIELAEGVTVSRLRPNVFEFAHGEERVSVDLNLRPGETYECPYQLGYRHFRPEYFSIIHSGEGDGWDANRPCMSSIITYQGRLYLIDAGPQLAHILTALGIGIDQVDGIFHTHAHDDHFAGLTVLMRAGRRINYYASPLVRASVTKKLTALLGMEEERIADFFIIHDLPLDSWTDIEGLEVKPILSPHPVETNIFLFRTLGGKGYHSYAHWADIVSMSVLRGMVNEEDGQPGLSQALFEQTRAAYLTPADIKKIDIGGGMIHGDAQDFRADASHRILLAHRATDLTPVEKEIGSSAMFGTVDTLIPSESDSLRRKAFGYLEAHLPGVPTHYTRLLINYPLSEVNPGAIVLKEGEVPSEVLLLLSGRAEKIRTSNGLYGNLPAGALIGDLAVLDNRPSQHTYRASSFLRVLRLPRAVFEEVVRRNGLLEHRRSAAELSSFLDTTNLFGDGLPLEVLGHILEVAVEREYAAGEDIEPQNDMLYIIRRGRIERSLGKRVLDILEARDVFGEETTIFRVPLLSHLKALEETTVIQIAGEALENIPILRLKLLESYRQRTSWLMHGPSQAESVFAGSVPEIEVARMDRHHGRILEIADAVMENLDGAGATRALAKAFAVLIDYTAYHFHAEESLMEEYAFPGVETHALIHKELLSQLRELYRAATSDVSISPETFRDFIAQKLIAHFAQEDLKYARFLNAMGVY